MKKFFSALAITTALIATPFAVNAHQHSSDNYQKISQHKKFESKHGHKLDLSQEQKDQLFKFRNEQAQAVYDQKKIARQARKDLRALSESGNFDLKQAQKIAETLGQAKAQLALLHAQSKAKFFEILTPEQKQKVADAKQFKHHK